MLKWVGKRDYLMNKNIIGLFLILMLNVAVVVQQPDSSVYNSNQTKESLSKESKETLSRQARVIEPVTTTNWSKISDLFK